MKTTTLLLVASMTVILTDSVFAENSVPPGGPYRSVNDRAVNEGANYSAPQNMRATTAVENLQNQPSQQPQQFVDEAPEWVKQRQAEMDAWVKQQHAQQPEWQRQMQSGSEIPPEVPQWVKQQQEINQQQMEMQQRMMQQNMPQAQRWNNQPPAQWQQFPAHPGMMPEQSQAMDARSGSYQRNYPGQYPGRYPGQYPENNMGNMRQNFPSARGPVSGPAVPPPNVQPQTGYYPQRYTHPYPPAWR